MGKLKQYHNSAWETRAQGSGSGGGASTFVDLTDTPASFSGAGSKMVAVNSGATALEFIAAPTTSFDTNFSVYMSAAKTVENTALTKIDTFDTVIVDSNSEWDAVNLWWECVDSGTYIINVAIQWAVNATGYRSIHIYVDGATVQARSYGAPSSVADTNIPITYKVTLTTGQYVEIYGRQSSGGALNAVVGVPTVEWQVWRIK